METQRCDFNATGSSPADNISCRHVCPEGGATGEKMEFKSKGFILWGAGKKINLVSLRGKMSEISEISFKEIFYL